MTLSASIYNKIKGKHSCYIAVKTPGKNYGDVNQYCNYFDTVTMCRATVYNANRIATNNWRSLQCVYMYV